MAGDTRKRPRKGIFPVYTQANKKPAKPRVGYFEMSRSLRRMGAWSGVFVRFV
jgi:hypothetical protein